MQPDEPSCSSNTRLILALNVISPKVLTAYLLLFYVCPSRMFAFKRLQQLALLALSSGYLAEAAFGSTYSPDEATWKIQYGDYYKLLNVTKSGVHYLYVLTSTGRTAPVAGQDIPSGWSAATNIQIPINKMALMSSTHIGFAEVKNCFSGRKNACINPTMTGSCNYIRG